MKFKAWYDNEVIEEDIQVSRVEAKLIWNAAQAEAVKELNDFKKETRLIEVENIRISGLLTDANDQVVDLLGQIKLLRAVFKAAKEMNMSANGTIKEFNIFSELFQHIRSVEEFDKEK